MRRNSGPSPTGRKEEVTAEAGSTVLLLTISGFFRQGWVITLTATLVGAFVQLIHMSKDFAFLVGLTTVQKHLKTLIRTTSK